jgi:hypothetical protein
MTDDVWNALVANLKEIDGKLFLHKGKVAADLKMRERGGTRRLVFAPSATGKPKSVSDLLRRGSFEQQAALFCKAGGPRLHVTPGPQRDLEIPEIALTGAILGVQSMADHHRGLQDVGLAGYSGRGWVGVVILIALTVMAIGAILQLACKHDPDSAECIAGDILFALGSLGLGVAAIFIIGALGSQITPPSTPLNPGACASGKICYDPVTGEAMCC